MAAAGGWLDGSSRTGARAGTSAEDGRVLAQGLPAGRLQTAAAAPPDARRAPARPQQQTLQQCWAGLAKPAVTPQQPHQDDAVLGLWAGPLAQAQRRQAGSRGAVGLASPRFMR
jgi:hypothetical protein